VHSRGDNGPSRSPILSRFFAMRFEELAPGWFSRLSGQGGFQPVTSSLFDLFRAVLVPVNAFYAQVEADYTTTSEI
jgi:hypothetical protein